MGDSNCDHPRSSVVIIEDEIPPSEVGESPPKHWTILGECKDCGEIVEIDYRFNKIER